jgi:hypothetical protein
MAEDTTPATGDDATPTESTEDLGDKGKLAIQREREARKAAEKRAKENEDAARRLAELEDANRSEVDKATTRAQEAEARVAQLEVEALRRDVGADKGLTAAQAKRLIGSTREELEADADELIEAFHSEESSDSTEQPHPSFKPTTRLRPGTGSDDTALNGDPLEQMLKKKLGIR